MLAAPPNPIVPNPNVNGAVNRVLAIDGQVNSLNDFVANTILSVMGVEPSPFRVDLIPALEAVGDVSGDIVLVIDEFLKVPPNPVLPELEEALMSVRNSANALIMTVDNSIAGLGDLICTPYDSEVGCDADTGCILETNNAGVNT